MRLRVAQHMSRGHAELAGGQRDIFINKNIVPRDKNIVKHHQRIALVKTARQRIVEHTGDAEGIRPARIEFHARSAVRHDARDCIVFVARFERQDHRDKNIVRHDRAGAEHLRATYDDTASALGRGAGVKIGLALLVRRLGAIDGRMDDDIAQVKIFVRRLGGKAQKIVGKPLAAARIEFRRTGEAGKKRRHVIRRAAEKAVTGIRPELDRAPARRQVFARARHQPSFVDRSAVARRRIGHQFTIGRIVRPDRKAAPPCGSRRQKPVRGHIRHALAVH